MRKSTGLPSRRNRTDGEAVAADQNSCELPNHEMENQKPLISTARSVESDQQKLEKLMRKMAPCKTKSTSSIANSGSARSGTSEQIRPLGEPVPSDRARGIYYEKSEVTLRRLQQLKV